jgi:hypothetical protein
VEFSARGVYHHSLRALAIRNKKIHAIDLPDLQLDGTPVYLDVEGLPDRELYYLIGVRVGNGDDAVQHSFWADDENEEKRIWEDFLGVLEAISNPQLIYYGSYETTFLKRMRERYSGPRKGSVAAIAMAHPTNLLSLVYARIYFPTFSNGLKDIAGISVSSGWVRRRQGLRRLSGDIVGKPPGTTRQGKRCSTTTDRIAKRCRLWRTGWSTCTARCPALIGRRGTRSFEHLT